MQLTLDIAAAAMDVVLKRFCYDHPSNQKRFA